MSAGEFPFAIEAALLDALELAAPGRFTTRLDFEPREFSGRELPGATLFWQTVDDEDTKTGPATDATWTWRLNIYANLAAGYEEAQRELKELVPLALLCVRRDPNLGLDEPIKAQLRDPGEEPQFSHGEGLVWKTLTFTAVTEETS